MKQRTLIEGFWDRADIALKSANLNKKQAAFSHIRRDYDKRRSDRHINNADMPRYKG
jgi:hypothetical protein